MPTTPRVLRRLGRGVVVLTMVALGLLTVQAAVGPVTQTGFDAEGERIVTSAIGRFEAARLDLPLTHVRPASFGDRCQPRGRAMNSWPVRIVRVCAVQEEVVVHELAHVWTFVNLSEGDRHEFALRRGTPTWRSREHPWMDRASEHAADIITWYLYWSESEGGPYRIGGDMSIEAYMADLSWLMMAAEAPAATEILAARAVDLAPFWVAAESQ